MLTVEEVAALLRVNNKTIYECVRRGVLPGSRRIGKIIRFFKPALLAWLERGVTELPTTQRGQARREPPERTRRGR